MDKYPTYLIHFNKNHSPKNGQFTNGDGDGDGIANDHEHYKELKKNYKQSIKDAKKEFRKVRKETGKNKVFQSRSSRAKATELLDRYAYKKSEELYEEYINLKKYKAQMEGKEFNPKSLHTQEYFKELGLDPNVIGILYPTINEYSVRASKIDQKPNVRKDATRLYFVYANNG